jgi:O-antigen/teichoic acid export membrane protein
MASARLHPIKQLAGQTLVYGAGTMIPRLLNYLLLTPFYTRVFGQGEYGIITELYAYVAFLMVLLTYGMETAYFRFAEREPDPRKVYSTSLLTLFMSSSAFVILVVVFAQPIAGFIRYPDNKEYIIYFSFIVALDAVSAVPFARLRKQNQAFRFAFIKIIGVILNIGLNFFFLWLCPLLAAKGDGSFIRLLYNENIGVGYAFISNLASSIVVLFLLTPDILKIKFRYDPGLIRRMLRYALPLLVVGLAGMINEVSDKIFLKYLWPDPATAMNQVGIYGANFRLAVLMTLFTQMFRYAAEPFFFARARDKDSRILYADVMKYFVIFGLFIFLGVMLYLDLFKYFIGPDFREGLHIVPIILLANLFLGISYNLSFWYKLNDMTRYGAYISIVAAVVTVVANIALIPYFGYTGSAWAHFLCYTVMMTLSFFLGNKYYPVRYDYGRIGTYSLSALGFYMVSRVMGLGSLPLRLVVNTVFFGLFAWLVYRMEKGRKIASR